ncbi:MAG: bacillithiol biosynthesis BshC [Actinomycetota bacterium]|nr:bacillithiol biosynthesis BshC [Actinomycetota bacterium]
MFESKEVHTKKFYYNNLYRDYIFNFEKLSDFYQHDYRNIQSYRERVTDIRNNYDDKKRLKVYDILKAYNTNIGCSSRTLENIEKFKKSDSAIVTGGQQPGLLGGPLFIIYKILTILKLSSFLEKELKIPVVPCFWNASDDSVRDEVDNINILTADNEIKNIKIDLSGINKNTRYSDIWITKDVIDRVIDEIEKTLYPTDFKNDIVNFYRKSVFDIFSKGSSGCTSGKNSGKEKLNISTFFSAFITRMFYDYGIVIIDPSGMELKKLSFNLLEFDIDNSHKINQLINSAGKNLKKIGYHNQITSLPGTLNSFYCREGIRYKIYSDYADLHPNSVDKNSKNENRKSLFKMATGEEAGKEINKKADNYSKKDLMELFMENPSNVSLNVVLRPLFQDSQLPVLCSVCGPGEISYMAQLKSVYSLYGLRMPVIYPRFSATIIEKKIKKLLLKLEISEEELEMAAEEVIKMKVGMQSKVDVSELMQNLERDILLELEKVEKAFMDTGISISHSFDRIKRNMKKEIIVLENKIYSELKKQDEFILEGVNKVYTNIFPNNNLQEREINIATYLNKYGFKLVDELYSVIEPFGFLHKFLEVI